MYTQYSKPIDPTQFQKAVLKDIQAYTKKMGERSKKYAKKAKVKVDSCYVCGQRKFTTPILKVYGWEYVRCKNCDHVFTTKRLSQEMLNEFYTESSEYASTYTSKEQIEYRLKNIAKPKIDFAMSQISFKKKGGRWLDIGCAIGDTVKCIDSYPKWKGTGLEISSDSVATGKKMFGIDLRQQLFKDFARENPNEKFDVISFFGYLEVISDPLDELKIAKKMLNKGGYIVIGEANSNSLTTMVQQGYPSLSRRHLLPPTVPQQFNKNSMTYFLKQAKLKPTAFWNFGLDFYELTGHLSMLIKGFEDTSIYDFLMRNQNEFQAVVDKQEMGDNFIIVAK